MRNSRNNRVVLRAWVDPVLREYARLEAEAAGIDFSEFISNAIQQAVSKASMERAIRAARDRDEQ